MKKYKSDVKKLDIAKGLLSESHLMATLSSLRIPIVERAMSPDDCKHFSVSQSWHTFALPVTFTPYASVKPCSARCWFCSENLKKTGASQGAASLRPDAHYQALLKDALNQLKDIPLGLSLSGLEITDDLDWLQATLQTLREWGDTGCWQDKAGYTNAAGLADPAIRKQVIDQLALFGFERFEVSRHHFDADVNQTIMNFRADEHIKEAGVFESTLTALADKVPVSLVCIIQRHGIRSYEDVDNYLAWARHLGVQKVIFRELCDLPSSYINNKTFIKIQAFKQGVEPLIEHWLQKKDVVVNHVTNGYYFWNANFTYANMEVIFERSDYAMMNTHHNSEIVYKLVFFPNGHLCAGWEPEKQILYKAHVR